MKRYYIVFMLMMFGSIQVSSAMEIKGHIDSVNEKSITIRYDGDLAGSVGDMAKVTFIQIDGSERVIGKWKIVTSQGRLSAAKHIEVFEKPGIGQNVVVYGAGEKIEPSLPVVQSSGKEPKPIKPELDPNKPNSIDPNHPKVATLIKEWISVAEPPMNATDGANARYEPYGRWVGEGINGIIGKVTANPDDVAGRTPEKYVWDKRNKLDSVDNCTLGEYVIAKLKNDSIDHCNGRYKEKNNTKLKKQAEELIKKAKDLWKRGSLAEAIKTAKKASQIVPKDTKIAKIHTAMQKQKKTIDNKLNTVSSKIKNNKLKEAEAELARASRISTEYPRYKKAKKELEDAKTEAKEERKRKEQAEKLMKKAKDLWKRGALGEAIRTAKKASRIVPKDTKIAKIHKAMNSQKKIMDNALSECDSFIGREEFKKAKRTLKKAERISSNYPPYVKMLDKLRKVKGKFDQIKKIIKEAKQEWKRKKQQSAISKLDKALTLNPRHKEAGRLKKEWEKILSDQVKASKPNWDNGCYNGENTGGAMLQWTLRDPPPYSGLTPICSDRDGKLWILNNHISQIIKGKLNRYGCYSGSTVKAKNRDYGGTLCRPQGYVEKPEDKPVRPDIPVQVNGTLWDWWAPIYGYGKKCLTKEEVAEHMKVGVRPDKDGWYARKNGGSMKPTGKSCTKPRKNVKPSGGDVVVTDVVGLSKKQAEKRLKKIGLKTKITLGDPALTKRDGLKVQKSIPSVGTTVKRGSTVTLIVHPPYVDKRTVPSLEGDTENEVVKKIKNVGLIPKINKLKASSSSQSGIVSSVRPSSGTEVLAGTIVFVDVFDTYIEKIVVPNVIGMRIKQADRKIKALGLKSKFKLGAKTEQKHKDKTVARQEPKAGTKVSKDTKIKLFISRYVAPKTPDKQALVRGTLWDWWGPIPYGSGKKCLTEAEVYGHMKAGAKPNKDGWYTRKKGGRMRPTGKNCTKPGEIKKPSGGGTIVFSDDVDDFNAEKVTKVPNVIGLSIREASNTIKSAGLKPSFKLGTKTSDAGKNKTVFKQNPTHGTKIKPGGKVKMSVYTLKKSSRQSKNKPNAVDKPVYCSLGKATFVYDPNIDYYVFRSDEIKENRRHLRREYKIFGDYNKRSVERAQRIQREGKMEYIMKAPLKKLCPHLIKNCHSSEEPFVGDLCGKLEGPVIPSSGTKIEEIEETNPGGKSITTEAKCTNYNKCLTDMMQEIQQVSLNMASSQSSHFGCKYLGLGEAISNIAQDANSAGCTIAGNYAHTGDMIKATAGQMCASQSMAFDVNKFASCRNIGTKMRNDRKLTGSTIVFSDDVDDFNEGKTTTLPSVIGLSIQDASKRIKSAGLKPSFKLGAKTDDPAKDKKVARQEPRAGSKMLSGSKVKLFIYTLKPKTKKRVATDHEITNNKTLNDSNHCWSSNVMEILRNQQLTFIDSYTYEQRKKILAELKERYQEMMLPALKEIEQVVSGGRINFSSWHDVSVEQNSVVFWSTLKSKEKSDDNVAWTSFGSNGENLFDLEIKIQTRPSMKKIEKERQKYKKETDMHFISQTLSDKYAERTQMLIDDQLERTKKVRKRMERSGASMFSESYFLVPANTDVISFPHTDQAMITWDEESRYIVVRWRKDMHVVEMKIVTPNITQAKPDALKIARKIHNILIKYGLYHFPYTSQCKPVK